MMNEYRQELGTKNIGRLLFTQSYPAVIGLLVLSMYNLVDTIFIGQYVGVLGIAGLAISFPLQMIAMSIGQSIGAGSASIISRNIGAKKYRTAERTLGNFFTLIFTVSITMTILGFVFLTPILKLFGATDTILPFAFEYIRTVLFGTVFIMFASSGNNIIRAEGNAKFAMYVMIISAVMNIIFDTIFIVYLGWGMTGAALATVIAQVSAAIAAFSYFAMGGSGIYFHFRNLKLKLKIVKEIFSIGASSLARMVSGSITIILVNNALAIYGGDIAIAAMGIIQRLIRFVAIPLFGIVL